MSIRITNITSLELRASQLWVINSGSDDSESLEFSNESNFRETKWIVLEPRKLLQKIFNNLLGWSTWVLEKQR